MSLIKSISGIRGTIGGRPGEGLSPVDIVKFTAAYATFIRRTSPVGKNLIVVGRDARLSGDIVSGIVVSTLCAMGFDVVNIGLASTPTTEIAVTSEGTERKQVPAIAETDDFTFAPVEEIGHEFANLTYNRRHIEQVLALPLVNREAIAAANFTVAVDAVNSVGGVIIPQLLRALGVKNIIELNCEPSGKFAHTPEPIPENLTQISDLMASSRADVGFVVDPDVDRLAIVMEDGSMFVEEYTLVAVADYVLSHTPGSTVSNLSSSRALADVTRAHGCTYSASAVGEVNVTTEMKRTGAVIGGEGNGGVIYPEAHYGRDALVGVALFLSLMATSGKKVSELKAGYPPYAIAKNKIQLTPTIDVDAILDAVKSRYSDQRITDIDGVKIDFPDGWVHLRKSNTEPIIRIYSEAATMEQAELLADQIRAVVNSVVDR